MLLLSSGLEDFFHYNPGEHEFSPYRFHDDDPIFFHNGFKLTARKGQWSGDWNPAQRSIHHLGLALSLVIVATAGCVRRR